MYCSWDNLWLCPYIRTDAAVEMKCSSFTTHFRMSNKYGALSFKKLKSFFESYSSRSLLAVFNILLLFFVNPQTSVLIFCLITANISSLTLINFDKALIDALLLLRICLTTVCPSASCTILDLSMPLYFTVTWNDILEHYMPNEITTPPSLSLSLIVRDFQFSPQDKMPMKYKCYQVSFILISKQNYLDFKVIFWYSCLSWFFLVCRLTEN